ncbi:guaAA [Acrasis kona]|uniref:GuaAA n=1 Tax=Acrasis kona TaxID=1008807 RepID=A0AAW2Z804_9EUKA
MAHMMHTDMKSGHAKLCILDVGNRTDFFDGELLQNFFKQVDNESEHITVESDIYCVRYGHWPGDHRHSLWKELIDQHILPYSHMNYPPLLVEEKDFPEPKHIASTIHRCYDGLIIGGGGDSTLNDNLPYLNTLLEVIKILVNTFDFPTVGICFGSQSIIKALYGPDRVSTLQIQKSTPEYGYMTCYLNDFAKKHPIMTGIPNSFVQCFYHSDCFLIPQEMRLIHTKTWSNEAYQIPNRKCFGFQYHPCFTREEAAREFESLRESEPLSIIHHDGETDLEVSKRFAENFIRLYVLRGFVKTTQSV